MSAYRIMMCHSEYRTKEKRASVSEHARVNWHTCKHVSLFISHGIAYQVVSDSLLSTFKNSILAGAGFGALYCLSAENHKGTCSLDILHDMFYSWYPNADRELLEGGRSPMT